MNVAAKPQSQSYKGYDKTIDKLVSEHNERCPNAKIRDFKPSQGEPLLKAEKSAEKGNAITMSTPAGALSIPLSPDGRPSAAFLGTEYKQTVKVDPS